MTRASYFLIAITLSLCSSLGAQSSYTPTCFDSSRMAYWPKPKNGDTLVVVVRTLKPLTICARPLVRPPPPVITPPPVVMPVPTSNEPSGMTRLAERDFSTLALSGWGLQQGYGGAVTLVSDTTAPRSAPFVLQQNFTSQLPGGSSPGTIEKGLGAFLPQTIYLSAWLRLSTNFRGHSTGVGKQFHFWINGRNVAVLVVRGTEQNALRASMGLQGLAAPYRFTDGRIGTGGDLDPTLAPCVVNRGQWHQYEVAMRGNTPGSGDGRITYWLDGAKCGDHSGITFGGASLRNRWDDVMWSPTWGGIGGTITQTFFVQLDHLYVSGK